MITTTISSKESAEIITKNNITQHTFGFKALVFFTVKLNLNKVLCSTFTNECFNTLLINFEEHKGIVMVTHK